MREGKKVLVLAAEMFEDMELLFPVFRLFEEKVGSNAGAAEVR